MCACHGHALDTSWLRSTSLKTWSKSMAKYQQSYYIDLLSSNTKSVKIMSKTVAGLKFITLILRKFSSASWSTRLDSLNPAQLWNCLHWFFIQNVYQQLFRYFNTIFHDTLVVLASLCQIKSGSTSITLSYIPQGVHIQSCVENRQTCFLVPC